MNAKVTADQVARGVLVCQTLKEVGGKINFKQLLELTGVIGPGLAWASHFLATTKPKLGILLAGIAQFGGYEVLACVVDAETGERASRTYLRLHAEALSRRAHEEPAVA